MIIGRTFDEQLEEAHSFAHFKNVFLLGESGITKGCDISCTDKDIYVSDGSVIVKGRTIEVINECVEVGQTESGELFCKLVLELDLTKTNTASEFKQGYFTILTSTTNYPGVTQEDLDGTGKLYQMPFATFKKTVSGIQNFVDVSMKINASDIWARVASQNQTYLEEFETYYSGLKDTHKTEYENQKAKLEQEVRDDIKALENMIGIEKGTLLGWFELKKAEAEMLKTDASEYIHSKENEILTMMNELKDKGFVSWEWYQFVEPQESNHKNFKEDGTIEWIIGTNKKSIKEFKDDGSSIETRYINDVIIQTRTKTFDENGNPTEVIT